VHDLTPRDPHYADADRDEACVTDAVALESGAPRVVCEAIDLDHEPLLAPEQIHFDALHQYVVLRRRQARGAHQGQEPALCLGARERRALLACQQPPQRPGARAPIHQLRLQLGPAHQAAAQRVLDGAL
jgi:hypothetical protein